MEDRRNYGMQLNEGYSLANKNIFTCILGPGNIRLTVSIPLSTPSANTH